jgi:formylglycine-generating enzyme
MHGNVEQWCSDWYFEDYYRSSPVDNPAGPPTGKERVIRGGYWASLAWGCRSAARYSVEPEAHPTYVGFRVAVTEPQR